MKDIIKEFQSFKQNIYPKAYPIFNRLKLDDELSIENVYLIGTSYMGFHLEYIKSQLEELGSEKSLKNLYSIMYFFMYKENNILNRNIDLLDIPFSSILFISIFKNNISKIGEVEKGSDLEKLLNLYKIKLNNPYNLYTILFWVRFEKLLCNHDDNLLKYKVRDKQTEEVKEFYTFYDTEINNPI